jgi:hypothetical protein
VTGFKGPLDDEDPAGTGTMVDDDDEAGLAG